MVYFIFTKTSEKDFKKLPINIQKRIVAKLKEIKTHPDIFSILKTIFEFEPATHRIRIGNYRLILELKSQEKSNLKFRILKIGHRKEIYK